MDAELKRKWVEALRSGKYQQGRLRLRYDNKFCCWGVLCDIVDASRWKDDKWAGEWDMAPGELCEAVGFTRDCWPVPRGQDATVLSEMNDHGESFAEIADYIEANL